MQEFDHIQSLWQSHSVEVKISSDEMLMQAKKEVASITAKSRLNVLGMIFSFTALAALLLFAEFESWTTLVGLSIIVILVGIYTFILYLHHRLIAKNDFTEDPNAFLDRLRTYQLNKLALYNKLYWIYLVALSIGTIFYSYGKLDSFTLLTQICLVGFTALWILFCSTILRKAYLKREKDRIGLLIGNLERIIRQFKKNN